jgi:RNA polymerase sigma factor (sigma-70 family)
VTTDGGELNRSVGREGDDDATQACEPTCGMPSPAKPTRGGGYLRVATPRSQRLAKRPAQRPAQRLARRPAEPAQAAEQHLERCAIAVAISSGDHRSALTLLMVRYGERVYRFARARTRDGYLADDIRQQVFLEAYRDLERFAGLSSVQSWLFGIARHRCLDAMKARARWNDRFKNDALPEAETDDHDPDRDLDRSRLAQILAAALARLSPIAREAVVLRYQEQLSFDEIAARLGGRASALQQRVSRALPILREYVEAELCHGNC